MVGTASTECELSMFGYELERSVARWKDVVKEFLVLVAIWMIWNWCFLGRVDRQSMNNTPGGSMHVFPPEVRQDRGFLGWLFARMLLGMHTCFPSQRSQQYCASLFVLEGETRITKRCLQLSSLIWRDS